MQLYSIKHRHQSWYCTVLYLHQAPLVVHYSRSNVLQVATPHAQAALTRAALPPHIRVLELWDEDGSLPNDITHVVDLARRVLYSTTTHNQASPHSHAAPPFPRSYRPSVCVLKLAPPPLGRSMNIVSIGLLWTG